MDEGKEGVAGSAFQMPDNFDLPDDIIKQHVSAEAEQEDAGCGNRIRDPFYRL